MKVSNASEFLLFETLRLSNKLSFVNSHATLVLVNLTLQDMRVEKTVIQTLVSQLSSILMQLSFSFDQDTRVKKLSCKLFTNIVIITQINFILSNRDKALLPLKKEISIREVDILRREISAVRLLQLVDIPMLENLLESFENYADIDDDYGSNNNLDVEQANKLGREHLDQTLELCDNDQEKTWLKATIECFDVQTKCPLPRKTEIGFRNSWNDSILGIFKTLIDYYQSIVETLFPANLAEVMCEVSTLLQSGKYTECLRALQLLVVLLPMNKSQHLHKLLQFMCLSVDNNIQPIAGVDSREGVCAVFMDAILPECEQMDKVR